jgi:hypothetical protein
MAIISPIFNRLNTRRLNQIDFFRDHPEQVQEELLIKLLAKSVNTEWGRLHDYSSIKSIPEYQRRIPLQKYEDIIPYIEKLQRGETNLLWPGEVKWFAKSSGTTSTRSKFIPVTREALEECHYRGVKDILVVYSHNRPDTNIFNGKGLILGGSHRINDFNKDSLCGDLSAILIENAPFWVELFRTPKTDIALLEDFEEKLERITRLTTTENVTNISGVPSWFLVLIKQILAYTGKKNLLDVWPRLEVFFHGGISFVPYREQFRHFINGEQMQYMETFNASEGFFGLQDNASTADMLLMLDLGVFYEFIPSEMADSVNPPVLSIGEVNTGVSYAMVISTNSGLWRYVIGDTIIFTSLRPHKFIISGRTKNFINAFGEEIIIDNAEKAIDAACQATGAMIREYTAGPIYTGTESKGSHEWLIEFERNPDDLLKFTNVLDQTLKLVNSDYDAKRFKDLNLVMPVVRSLPEGTFYKWLREKNKLGGQNKVPRLSNTRELVEQLLRISESESSKSD